MEFPNGRRPAGAPKASRSSARFWMPVNCKDWMFKTATMDAETSGALFALYLFYFMNGSLPKTDAEIARVCKLSGKKFVSRRSQLLAGFDDEGRNAEIDASIEEIERKVSKNREAGRSGGQAKAVAFASRSLQRNASQLESESQLEEELQTPPESSSASSPPPAPPPLTEPRAREADEVTAEALASLPLSARAHPGWRALSAWIAHQLGNGVERVDIVVGITQCLASLKDQPPSTFGYFTKAIERAREVRTRPLPEVPQPKSSHHQLGDSGETLKKWLGNDVFAAWFGGAKLIGLRDDMLMISVATPFIKSRIVSDYGDLCLKAFKQINPRIARLHIEVDQ